MLTHQKLTNEQKKVYSLMKQGKNIFITGGGGVGKSELIKYFYNKHKYDKNLCLYH